MPKSANSIDCPCGGHYVKKNQSKHFKTKKHQKYEEEQLEKCANCKEELTEDTHIFTLSKNDEEKTWCSTCFYDCAVDARNDGWTFDEQGEQLLDAEDEEEEEQNTCRHCGKEAEIDKDTTECSECGMYQDIDVADE